MADSAIRGQGLRFLGTVGGALFLRGEYSGEKTAE